MLSVSGLKRITARLAVSGRCAAMTVREAHLPATLLPEDVLGLKLLPPASCESQRTPAMPPDIDSPAASCARGHRALHLRPGFGPLRVTVVVDGRRRRERLCTTSADAEPSVRGHAASSHSAVASRSGCDSRTPSTQVVILACPRRRLRATA